MKKLALLLLVIILTGCNNVKSYGPFKEEKAGCKENADTILQHIAKGWKVYYTDYYKNRFMSQTNRDGKREDYYKWGLMTYITNGSDTMVIITDDNMREYNNKTYEYEPAWTGRIIGYNNIGTNDIHSIKQHNLAIKKLCDSDSCFNFSLNSNKTIYADFVKMKPKEPEHPLEDYGLDEDDL